MLASFLLLVSLGQPAAAPDLFLWIIDGLADAKSQALIVTVTPTPFGLVRGVDLKTISLDPLPTRDDPTPRSIQPLKTEPAPKWALRAWFTPPKRRFHLIVTLSNGSTHKIDIYRKVPRADVPGIYKARPLHLIAPRGTWTAHGSRHYIRITS